MLSILMLWHDFPYNIDENHNIKEWIERLRKRNGVLNVSG